MATRGRPTKYKKVFCDMLIKHMSEGLSFESFAGLDGVDVSKEVLYDWCNAHEDFLNAKKMGQAKCMVFWEKLGRAGAGGKVPGFQNGAWIFNMKNRFLWKDRTDVVHTEIKATNKDLNDDQVEDAIDAKLAKRKARKSRATKTAKSRKSTSRKGKST